MAQPPRTKHDRSSADGVAYYDSDFSFLEHSETDECLAYDHRLRLVEAARYLSPNGAEGGAVLYDSGSSQGDINTGIDDPNNVCKAQAGRWNDFHSTHTSGFFFKSRRYITKCFPCLVNNDKQNIGNGESNVPQRDERLSIRGPKARRLLLEIGCGSGSTCVPILRTIAATIDDDTVLLACDTSSVAVEVTRRCVEEALSEGKDEIRKTFAAFVADPAAVGNDPSSSLLELTCAAYRQLCEDKTSHEHGIADVTICVFVLSAVWPSRAPSFVKQIYDVTRPGGRVAFRDYGMFDMPMLRFDPETAYVSSIAPGNADNQHDCLDADGRFPRLFRRGDQTLSRFFHIETIGRLFVDAGFEVEELRYATVYNLNRKTGQKLKRVFIHGLFRKLGER